MVDIATAVRGAVEGAARGDLRGAHGPRARRHLPAGVLLRHGGLRPALREAPAGVPALDAQADREQGSSSSLLSLLRPSCRGGTKQRSVSNLPVLDNSKSE